ncbi:hypothetical protein GJAV_G00087810 [Gymnothorax javanicus]|nr:hypothetical protein GJAV_G00087810 [Gymnothorax javanicus]
MAESETKCSTPGLNTLEPECLTANSRVSDLQHTEASLIKTETDLSPSNTEDLKTESLDFTELAYVTHENSDQIKTETDGDYIKTEDVSILPDIKCVYIKSDEVKLESSETLVSYHMCTVLNGAGVDENGQTGPCHCTEEPYASSKKSGKKWDKSLQDVRIHISEKPHQFFESEKCLIGESVLNNDHRIQTGEKPYKCEQCGKGFPNLRNLHRHTRVHTGHKPYKCEQCGKSFADKSSLKSHQSIHTGEKPYKCDQCEKFFAHKSVFKSHQRIHEGEKPYKCEQCGKSFTKNSNLKYHQRIHTGEKPYMCDQCGKVFCS